jgi:hypothetical protein
MFGFLFDFLCIYRFIYKILFPLLYPHRAGVSTVFLCFLSECSASQCQIRGARFAGSAVLACFSVQVAWDEWLTDLDERSTLWDERLRIWDERLTNGSKKPPHCARLRPSESASGKSHSGLPLLAPEIPAKRSGAVSWAAQFTKPEGIMYAANPTEDCVVFVCASHPSPAPAPRSPAILPQRRKLLRRWPRPDRVSSRHFWRRCESRPV